MTTNSQALSIVDAGPSTVTADQVALIKSTIAKDATDAELQLFFHDCLRQGVHPLDKLIHFTKRSGKYTPITSIDFMRIRAAATGECIGIDDATFTGTPKAGDFAATVTVWRLVQGQRSAFTATARWSEYKPDQNDFMWQKMPFVMLGKCAEALALRKGFPQQLAGLYAKEELDQADADADDRADRSTRGRLVRETTRETSKAATKISRSQQKKLFAVAKEHAWSDDALRRILLDKFGVRRTSDLTVTVFAKVLEQLAQGPTVEPAAPADQTPPADQIPF
jgi:phage recombination protein Bet